MLNEYDNNDTIIFSCDDKCKISMGQEAVSRFVEGYDYYLSDHN
jgi:hypothetical protein